MNAELIKKNLLYKSLLVNFAIKVMKVKINIHISINYRKNVYNCDAWSKIFTQKSYWKKHNLVNKGKRDF